MLTANDIGWGKYKGYEGPYFRGSRKFVPSAAPTVEEKQLSVVTATEGGAMDAVNMYDQCIVSVGLIQWCEASYFLTSKLIGAILEQDQSLVAPLTPAMSAAGAGFSKGTDGKWRFRTAAGVVDERPEQTGLFLLRSSGAAGSWDDESRARAKLWAACLANFLAQDGAASVQVPYTATRLRSFATAAAAKILWDGSADDGFVGATRAAFISFAANLPAVASDHLVKAASANGAAKWSRDWCVGVLRELTFGPGISIYPGRYEKIRPVIEKAYGVDLPDFAQDLQNWRSDPSQIPRAHSEEPTFEDPKDVQHLLIALGYDIGPSGADGKIGTKTMDAIGTFQGMKGLVDTRTMNVDTRNAMVLAWRQINPA